MNKILLAIAITSVLFVGGCHHHRSNNGMPHGGKAGYHHNANGGHHAPNQGYKAPPPRPYR